MNDVTKVMMFFTRALEVGHNVVSVDVVAREGASRREVEVADDFVDVDPTRDATSFFVLRLELLRPALLYALIDAVRIGKAPTLPRVGFSYLFASVAARGVACSLAAVTRTAVVFSVELGYPVRFSFEAFSLAEDDGSARNIA